jgi:hypothetical protein
MIMYSVDFTGNLTLSRDRTLRLCLLEFDADNLMVIVWEMTAGLRLSGIAIYDLGK